MFSRGEPQHCWSDELQWLGSAALAQNLMAAAARIPCSVVGRPSGGQSALHCWSDELHRQGKVVQARNLMALHFAPDRAMQSAA